MRLRPEQRARGHLGPATCCKGKMPRQAGHPQLQYGEEELKAQRAAQAGMASRRQLGKNPGPLRLGFSLPLRQREPLTPEKFPAEAASFVWGPGSLLRPHTVRSRGPTVGGSGAEDAPLLGQYPTPPGSPTAHRWKLIDLEPIKTLQSFSPISKLPFS